TAEIILALRTDGMVSQQPEERWSNSDLNYLRRWFDEAALSELGGILLVTERMASGTLREFLIVCLSNIVRRVSWQKDSDLRVRKDKTRYYPGTAIDLFCEEIERQAKKLGSYLRLASESAPFKETLIREGDSRHI